MGRHDKPSTGAFGSRATFIVTFFLCRNLSVDTDVDRASHVVPLGSSAQRRRLRRLRSWWRHERQAVTAALASAQHHSASRVVSTATQTEAPVTEHVVPALVVTHAAPAPVFEYATPAPVIEYIVPALAKTRAVSCQQLPPVYTTTAVNTDVNFDTTGLVNPQFSNTAFEATAPQVVGSLPPFEAFDAPVYNQVHQEQIVAGKMTLEHSSKSRCARTGDRSGKFRASGYGADTRTNCGDHQGGSTGACSTAHRRTNCARACPSDTGASDRARSASHHSSFDLTGRDLTEFMMRFSASAVLFHYHRKV